MAFSSTDNTTCKDPEYCVDIYNPSYFSNTILPENGFNDSFAGIDPLLSNVIYPDEPLF
jgi:hypothetical protein